MGAFDLAFSDTGRKAPTVHTEEREAFLLEFRRLSAETERWRSELTKYPSIAARFATDFEESRINDLLGEMQTRDANGTADSGHWKNAAARVYETRDDLGLLLKGLIDRSAQLAPEPPAMPPYNQKRLDRARRPWKGGASSGDEYALESAFESAPPASSMLGGGGRASVAQLAMAAVVVGASVLGGLR